MVEITDRDELKTWLNNQPQEVSVAIAARVALRTLCVGWQTGWARDRKTRSALLLPLLCATAAPWVAASCPTQGAEDIQRAAADSAAFSAAADSAAFSAAAAAAAAAADAAYSAAYSAYSAAYSAAAAAFSAFSAAAAAVWKQITQDCAFIEDHAPADGPTLSRALTARALWQQGGAEFIANWRKIEKILLEADEGWEVWTTWYDRRLEGGEWNEALEVERVISKDIPWDSKDPVAINSALAAIEAKHAIPTPRIGGDEGMAPEVRASRSEFLMRHQEATQELMEGVSTQILTALDQFQNEMGINDRPLELQVIEKAAISLRSIGLTTNEGRIVELEAEIASLKAQLEALTASNLPEFWKSFTSENGKQAAITLHKAIRYSFVAGTIYVFGDDISAKFLPDLIKAFSK